MVYDEATSLLLDCRYWRYSTVPWEPRYSVVVLGASHFMQSSMYSHGDWAGLYTMYERPAPGQLTKQELVQSTLVLAVLHTVLGIQHAWLFLPVESSFVTGNLQLAWFPDSDKKTRQTRCHVGLNTYGLITAQRWSLVMYIFCFGITIY